MANFILGGALTFFAIFGRLGTDDAGGTALVFFADLWRVFLFGNALLDECSDITGLAGFSAMGLWLSA